MKNSEKEIEFINAAGAVYAWMCVCYGNITVDESEGFAKYLNKLPYIKNTSHQDFIKSYVDILHLFEEKFDDAYKQTLVRVAPLKSNKQATIDLIKIAREVMVIDEKLEDVEENVIRELCTILGVNEDEVV